MGGMGHRAGVVSVMVDAAFEAAEASFRAGMQSVHGP